MLLVHWIRVEIGIPRALPATLQSKRQTTATDYSVQDYEVQRNHCSFVKSVRLSVQPQLSAMTLLVQEIIIWLNIHINHADKMIKHNVEKNVRVSFFTRKVGILWYRRLLSMVYSRLGSSIPRGVNRL